jgi:hypothetical protein
MEAGFALSLIFLLSQNLQGNLALGVATFDKFRVKSAAASGNGCHGVFTASMTFFCTLRCYSPACIQDSAARQSHWQYQLAKKSGTALGQLQGHC